MHLVQCTSPSCETREGSLDEFIAHLADTYPRVPHEAWQDFKVAAIGKQRGKVTLRYDVDEETNSITVCVAQLN
jgi:hypothetical protein